MNHLDRDFMRMLRLVPLLALSLAVGGCSDDAPLADPGGMGAGRPEAAGGAETPAQEVLGVTGHPEQQDTTAAGAPGMTGTLRDSLHDGEAIPGVTQPQPERPGY